jgi:Phage major capsid protein E
MATYTYPTSAELRLIEQDKLPLLVQDDPLFEMFPIVEVDEHLLIWEQYGNFIGLQQWRGFDGAPNKVSQTAISQYTMQPGVYGETEIIGEAELTQARMPGTFGDPINFDQLVAIRQDKLLQRRLDRIRWIGWTLMTTGAFTVASPSGGTVHTDTYNLATFSAVVPWSTHATATPLADIRTMQLLSRGHSVAFDSGAKLFLNRKWYNHMIANTNTSDLGGRRTQGLATFDNLGQVNQLLTQDGLPNIAVYDEGYYPDGGGGFTQWIPDNVGVLVGRRVSGVSLGEYRLTRNANNPNAAPGAYTFVRDEGLQRTPRQLIVEDGHNGGPVVFFPSAIVTASL